MKSIVLIILAVLLAVALSGCAEAPRTDPPSPSASADPAEAEDSPAAVSVPQTPEPSPLTPAPSPAGPLMRLGTTSPDVLNVQSRLMELGYLAREKATQYYDVETRDAVALFQQNAGLEPTGELDEATLAALLSEEAPARVPPVAPPPAQTPAPPSVPEPTPEVFFAQALAGIRIGLDPGHQARGDSQPEPVAPGSGETKPRVASGTQGVSSGVAEFAVNMQIAEKLRALLEAQGAEVVMTRESNDADISNAERAKMMNEAGVDLVVRLHCNGDADSSRSGAFVLIPSGSYTESIQETSRAAAEAVLSAFVESTGASNLGISERSDQTGFNWSEVPVFCIEMGHMTNPREDELLVSDDYQELCAKGICRGIIDFFAQEDAAG